MTASHGKTIAWLSALAMAAIALGCGRPAISSKRTVEISLPKPVTAGKMSVEEAIAKRRSVRAFADRRLSMMQVSQLVWAAQGVTDSSRGFRAAPSAGATYPLELYVVTSDGAFHYLPGSHRLVQISDRDLRTDLAEAALGQGSVRQAPVSLVFAAVYERTRARYGERAERYVHMEAGHAAENVHLQAVALGLGSVPVGAFDDRRAAKLLGLPAEQAVLYIVPVGYPAKG